MTNIVRSLHGNLVGLGPNDELLVRSGIVGGSATALRYAQLVADTRLAASKFPNSTFVTSDVGPVYSDSVSWLPATSAAQKTLLNTQLKNTRNALNRIYAGTGRGRTLVLGDSTRAGVGAGTSGTSNSVGAFAKGPVRYLATRLTAGGIPASDNSFFGDQGMITLPTAYGLYDTRVVLGANWSAPSGGSTSTLAGQMFLYTTGAVNNLAFTPAGQCDTAIVFYARAGSNGSFTWNVDGGSSLGTVTTNGGNAILSSTATFTKGAHTINLVPSNNGNFYIVGILAYDSTVPAMDIIQGGIAGALMAAFTTQSSAWHLGPALTFLDPDLTIIQVTINDSNASTAVATYKANLQALVTRALAVGDVIIESGIPSSGAGASLIAIVQAAREIAASNNVPFIDIGARWVDYTAANGLGWMNDTLHPNALGYPDIGRIEAGFLTSIG